MNDDEILAGILRRWFATPHHYYCWSDDRLTLDSSLDISAVEAAALDRAGNRRGWWHRLQEIDNAAE